jgi:hypothetical protein
VSKHTNEDELFFGAAPARPTSALSDADGRPKPQRKQDKQTAASSIANLPKRPKSSLREHPPNPEAISRTRSDVAEQVATQKSATSRPPRRAKPAAASQHGRQESPFSEIELPTPKSTTPIQPISDIEIPTPKSITTSQHGRAKSPFAEIELPTPKSTTPIQPISDIDIPTPKSITTSQQGRAKSPFSDTDLSTPKSVPAAQPGRPKPAISGTESPKPKLITANQHDGAKPLATPAEHITPKAAPSHHGKSVSDGADAITPKSIPTEQHGKSDTGVTLSSAEPNQRQSRPPDTEFIPPKPTATKTRPLAQERAKTPTRASEADTNTLKRSKTPTNSDATAAKSTLTKARPHAVDVCEHGSVTPKSASRTKPKAAQEEPTPAAKRRAATPLWPKSPAKKAGAVTPSKSENEIGFDLCMKDMELILASVPHEKPPVKQQVPPKARPLATDSSD